MRLSHLWSSIWHPFGALLAPVGSLLATFWFPLGSLLAILVAFSTFALRFCIFQLKAENTTAEWFEAINHAASVFHASPISRPSSAQFNAIKMTGDGESPYDAINVQKMQVDVEKRIASVTSQKSQKDVELITDAMDSFLGVLKATSLREAFEAYTRKLHTSENYVFHTHVLHFKMLCLNRDVALGALERRYWSRQAHFQALQIYRDLVDTSRDDNFQVTSESKVRAKIKKMIIFLF